jgi:hypothetical protein
MSVPQDQSEETSCNDPQPGTARRRLGNNSKKDLGVRRRHRSRDNGTMINLHNADAMEAQTVAAPRRATATSGSAQPRGRVTNELPDTDRHQAGHKPDP